MHLTTYLLIAAAVIGLLTMMTAEIMGGVW